MDIPPELCGGGDTGSQPPSSSSCPLLSSVATEGSLKEMWQMLDRDLSPSLLYIYISIYLYIYIHCRPIYIYLDRDILPEYISSSSVFVYLSDLFQHCPSPISKGHFSYYEINRFVCLVPHTLSEHYEVKKKVKVFFILRCQIPVMVAQCVCGCTHHVRV